MGHIFLKGNTRGTGNILSYLDGSSDNNFLNLHGTLSEPSGIPFGMENDYDFYFKELESTQIDHLDMHQQ